MKAENKTPAQPAFAPVSGTSNLQNSIAELENEIKRLSGELKEKRKKNKDDARRIIALIHELKARLKGLIAQLNESHEVVRDQRRVLSRMQKSHSRHAELLRHAEEQLARLESGEQTDDVTALRAELLGMLGELRDIRHRRESILHRISVGK